mmetsp:Transcript_126280/g.252290  ORF Transcript_126280/g.252290 Transcript_126280/m.252290 type:complete len:344 (-) Transcript_126280:50-1081(-)
MAAALKLAPPSQQQWPARSPRRGGLSSTGDLQGRPKNGCFLDATAEWLRGDLSAAKAQVWTAEIEERCLETERSRLAERIVVLEAENRRLRQEADQWRQRCGDLEQECHTLRMYRDSSEDAQEHAWLQEKDLGAKRVAGQLAAAEAENARLRAEDECQNEKVQNARLSQELHERIDDINKLKQELLETLGREEVGRITVAQLEAAIQAAVNDRDQHCEARQDAQQRLAAAEAQAKNYHSAVGEAAAALTSMASEADKQNNRSRRLEEANQKLRLDLQEMTDQALRGGELPFYGATTEKIARGSVTARASGSSRLRGPSGRRPLLDARAQALGLQDRLNYMPTP